MSTLSKLEDAFRHMKEAEKLLKEARKDKESLSNYHHFSLEVISQELNVFSDNSDGYLIRNTTLREIIDVERLEWNKRQKKDTEPDSPGEQGDNPSRKRR